jgi:hypothetical protein
MAGDPVSGLKWTHRSLRKLQKALRRRGIRLALATIARLLRERGFSLKTCRKQKAGLRDPDRDRQFRYIVRMRKLYLGRGLPVISADTKKKELVGDFKNPGRCWRRRPRQVLDHDYPSWALGQAIPVGIYDVGHNDGYVVVGTSHNTAAFLTAAIGRWWRVVGRRRYPGARRLRLEMDGGGANDPRTWLWKVALQRLADETGVDRRGIALPAGGLEMEPDRAPDVRPDQRQLGRGAFGQLREGREVHPHGADGGRVSLPSLSGPEGVSGAAACRAGGQGPGAAQARSGAPPMELHDLASSLPRPLRK